MTLFNPIVGFLYFWLNVGSNMEPHLVKFSWLNEIFHIFKPVVGFVYFIIFILLIQFNLNDTF